MYLIVGLGNPGMKYDATKHNMGFKVIDELVETYGIPSSGTSLKGMYGKGMIGGEKVILIKPMTYMNNSGECVRAFVDYYKVDPEEEVIIIYDDITLEPGSIRVRKKGSAGGHNGIKSIIAHLGTEKFKRIRVGVGEKPKNWDLADFVLSPFKPEEKDAVREGIEKAAKAVEVILTDGADAAMNRYNKKAAKPKEEKTGTD